MRPIAQTFYVKEPPTPTGVAGIFVTKVDVFFSTISNTHGVECQIRLTENGTPANFPSNKRLPFASKVILPGDLVPGATTSNATANNWALKTSTDGSKATTFIFDTPVFLESNKQYALVIIPGAGNPDYKIFTSKIGTTDLINKTPITTNNDTGDLFLSSNDLTWQPIIDEDLKFNIYTANFTSNSGTAYFTSPSEEYILYKDQVESFEMRELLVFGNGYYNYTVLNISSNTGAFNNGDYVYQSNGVANVGYGYVYAANSTVVKLANTTGVFYTAYEIADANSSANAVVSAVSQNVATTEYSNVISVPDSTVLNVNSAIYIQTSNRDYTQVVKITAKPSNTSIQTDVPIFFTDTNCLYGGLIANGNFTAGFSGTSLIGTDYYVSILDSTTANLAVNLSGVTNVQIIGLKTGSSANLVSLFNPLYNSITTNFNSLAIANTSLDWSFKGLKADNNYTQESTYNNIVYKEVNELVDTTRVLLSRSNEYGQLPVGRKGNNSLILKSTLQTQNTKISPVIDTIQKDLTYTFNALSNENNTKGVIINASYNNGFLLKGDKVTQNTSSQTGYANSTATGYVLTSNSTTIVLSNTNGLFVSNVAFTSNTANSAYASAGVNGNIILANHYSESIRNIPIGGSRWISKNVILAQGQDSEDILVYTTAHRPANTNLNIYASIKNNYDQDQITNKKWTRLREISPTTLVSNKTDLNDYVELVHGFYKSENIFLSNTVVSNASNTIVCQDTTGITNNSFIYTGISNSSVSLFNVRQVVHVLNTTAFTVDATPSFSSSNATLGIIPGIEDRESAFLYDQNNYIVRYSTSSDSVYDSYIQFALKVVFIADSPEVVPFMQDIRSIALQV